jgi:cytochrome c biogenesis protein CcdA
MPTVFGDILTALGILMAARRQQHHAAACLAFHAFARALPIIIVATRAGSVLNTRFGRNLHNASIVAGVIAAVTHVAFLMHMITRLLAC